MNEPEMRQTSEDHNNPGPLSVTEPKTISLIQNTLSQEASPYNNKVHYPSRFCALQMFFLRFFKTR